MLSIVYCSSNNSRNQNLNLCNIINLNHAFLCTPYKNCHTRATIYRARIYKLENPGFDREGPPSETLELHKIFTCQKTRPSITEESREPLDAKLASPAGVPVDDANDSRCALLAIMHGSGPALLHPCRFLTQVAGCPRQRPQQQSPTSQVPCFSSGIPYKHPWSSPMGFDNTLPHSQIPRPRLSSSTEKTTPYQSSQSRSSTSDSQPLKTSAPLLPDQLQAPADAPFSLGNFRCGNVDISLIGRSPSPRSFDTTDDDTILPVDGPA
ncbi:hypothetical protein NE237_012141 [Protea cynaroides]|uniref:Uncharacterized protein n=1 Tax=Protea cynaroides TaxID=273540 RepID=A0A9Q0GZ89_9MAGN|nr:hypothetical protein NE237_012141 [Protea cynaroides]